MRDNEPGEASASAEAVAPSRDWVRYAKWTSAAYGIVVAAALVGIGVSCGEESTARFCLAPNELGDVLAGVFAPLAFFWLAAAVLIQSQELSAQRRELRLTREELALTRGEYELSRKVLEAQVEEARRSAEFIGKQTEILEEERQERRAAEQDRIFDQRWRAMIDELHERYGTISFASANGSSRFFTYPEKENLKSLTSNIDRIQNAIAAGSIESLPSEMFWRGGVEVLDMVLELREKVSDPTRDRLLLSGIDDLRSAMEEAADLSVARTRQLGVPPILS